MSQQEIKQQLDQLSDKELETLAKQGKSIYNREYRKKNAAKVKRAQQRSYAKLALQAQADAELEGGVDYE